MKDMKFTKYEVISLIINLKILQQMHKGNKKYRELEEQIKMLEDGDHWAFLGKNEVKDLFPPEKGQYNQYLLFLQYWLGVIDVLDKNNIRKYDFNLYIDHRNSELVYFLKKHLNDSKVEIKDSHGSFDFRKYLDFLESGQKTHGMDKYTISFILNYFEENNFPTV